MASTSFIEFVKHNPFLRNIVYSRAKERSYWKLSRIEPFLKKGDKILDIGSGACSLAELLAEKGFLVTALDVRDQSFVKNIKPVVYDGSHIPFEDNKFDVSLLIRVLHHIRNPSVVLKEAKRVSRRVVIIEEIYEGSLQKYLTFLMDQLTNFEILGNPHSNKTDKEWKKLFVKLKLKLKDAKVEPLYKIFKSVTYHLEKI